MNCHVCRTESPSGSSFCPNCGAGLSPAKTPTSHGLRAREPALAFSPGQAFGQRYTIVEEVGAGGMGVVYKAIDRELRKTVALKLVQPDVERQAGTLERFRRELSLAQQVTHPNVCRVHDLGQVGGVHFISMEYVDGQTMRDWMQAVGSFSPRQTVSLARQICAALSAVHERAIVHRDLKPGNIMVDRSGHALVMDFGLATHPASDKITAEGELLGTLAFVAPEQGRGGPVDARADIYSLGLILFEMLTGRRAPGDGGRIPLALRQPGERCPPPSAFAHEVTPALDAVVLRCLERDPAGRFQTAGELDAALGKVAEELTTVVPAPVPPTPKKRAFSWRAMGAASGVVLAVVLGILLWPRPPSLSLPPWTYEGPVESADLAELFPVVLAEQFRAGGGVRVMPSGAEWTLEGKLDVHGGRFEAHLSLVASTGGRLDGPGRSHGNTGSVLGAANHMAIQIASALGAKPSRSKQALDPYLQGKKFLEGWDVEKNTERAEEAFSAAIAAEDRFAEAHAGLARALWTRYAATREPDLVERAFREGKRAVALDPSLPEAHLALGIVQLGRGLSAEAKASFENAQQLAPADDSVCLQIAAAYGALGRDDEAARMYQRAIDLLPGYWKNYNLAGLFYNDRSNWDQAKKQFSEVIRLRPGSDLGYTSFGAACLAAGELSEAEPMLEQSLRIHPTGEAHRNLGLVYYATGRFEEAAREFREAARALPEATPWGNLGDAYRQLGRLRQAREAYDRALELNDKRLQINPTDANARGFSAMCLAATGRCADAQQQAREATGSPAPSARAYYLVAIAYTLCHSREEAGEAVRQALSRGYVVDVRTNPDLKSLRSDPEIQKLLR